MHLLALPAIPETSTCDDSRFTLINCSVLISNACVYWTDTYILNINAIPKLNESIREGRISDLIRQDIQFPDVR